MERQQVGRRVIELDKGLKHKGLKEKNSRVEGGVGQRSKLIRAWSELVKKPLKVNILPEIR